MRAAITKSGMVLFDNDTEVLQVYPEDIDRIAVLPPVKGNEFARTWRVSVYVSVTKISFPAQTRLDALMTLKQINDILCEYARVIEELENPAEPEDKKEVKDTVEISVFDNVFPFGIGKKLVVDGNKYVVKMDVVTKKNTTPGYTSDGCFQTFHRITLKREE